MSQISNSNVYQIHGSNYTTNTNRINANMSPFTTPNLHAYKTQTTTQSVYSTLPITCHICLGKVKEPCVCPNLHAFCSFCIETWLEKSKQCPTCRITINKENPCRRVLGSADTFDDVDILKPTDFSHASIRKARFVNLFEQYEEEITRLNKHIDSLNVDITKLKEINNGSSGGQLQICAASPNKDLVQTLRNKLQFTQTSLEDVTRDRDRLKDSNKKLESENSILMQDLVRLKATLNEKNMMITSKYTMAALETKLESYEKEVKQLQKALDKSDKYIADLEQKQRDKENNINNLNNNKSQSLALYSSNNNNKLTTSPHNASNSYNLLNSNSSTNLNSEAMMTSPPCANNNKSISQMKFIKGDNQTFKTDLKIVKFAEKVDHIPSASAVTAASLLSPPSANNGSKNQQQSIITNDRFYGSPSKIQPPTPTSSSKQSNLASHSVTGVMSFNERLKKNSIHLTNNGTNGKDSTSSKFEFEAPTPCSNNNSFGGAETQSLINYDSNVNAQNNFRCNSTTSNVVSAPSASSSSQQPNHQFLFSPMKRLRLEEYTLEKPSFNAEDTFNNTINGNNLLNDTQQEIPRSNILKTPPASSSLSNTSNSFRHVSLSPSRYSSLDVIVDTSSTNNNINRKSGFSIASKSPVQNGGGASGSGQMMSRFYDDLKPSTSSTTSLASSSSNDKSNNHSSPEFIDCLEILDKAEKKVQNRFSPGPPSSVAISSSTSGHGRSCSNSSSSHANGNHALQLKTSQNYDLPEKYFRPTSTTNTNAVEMTSSHAVESSPLTISNVLSYNNSIKMNNNNNKNDSNGFSGGGSKSAVMASNSSFTLSSNSSSNNTGGNSLSATIPTGASSLASSHSSTSSFHSNSNANFMPLNTMTIGQVFDSNSNVNANSNGSLRRFSSFDQNINDLNAQSNDFSLNSTLTNKESQHQYENDIINRSRSVDPILRNSKA